jgi:methylphosphotriester-DNA--protein-cysteine methyltransferase
MHELSFKLNHHNIFYVNIDSSENDIERIFTKYGDMFNITNNTNKLQLARERIASSNSKLTKIADAVFNENQRYIKFRDKYLAMDNENYKKLESHERNILNINKENEK